ncbi:MAG: AAA family ATPase [Phycisphaerae bacterium]
MLNSPTLNSPPPPPSLLPIRHLTLLLGNPGVGKSLLAADLAARLTTNSLPPPHPSLPRPPADQLKESTRHLHPGTIIYLSNEDSFRTLRARLTAAGANPALALLPTDKLTLHHTHEHAEHPPMMEGLKRGILPPPLIYYLVDQLQKIRNPRLLILDPLPSFLGLKDSSNAALIRRLLDPLLLLAQHHNFAILGLSHLSKSAPRHTPHLLRSLGSTPTPPSPAPSSSSNPTPTTPNAASSTK